MDSSSLVRRRCFEPSIQKGVRVRRLAQLVETRVRQIERLGREEQQVSRLRGVAVEKSARIGRLQSTHAHPGHAFVGSVHEEGNVRFG